MGNFLNGIMSFGKLSGGKLLFGKLSDGKLTCGKLSSGKLSNGKLSVRNGRSGKLSGWKLLWNPIVLVYVSCRRSIWRSKKTSTPLIVFPAKLSGGQ